MRWIWVLLLGALLSGCATYDRVAVWYKYRRDFHLPKPQAEHLRPERESLTAEESTEAMAQGDPLRVGEQDAALSPAARRAVAAVGSHPAATPSLSREDEGVGSSIRVSLTKKDRTRLYRKLKAEFTPAGEPRRTHWATTTGFILTLAFAGLIGLAFWVGHMRLAGWNNLVWVVLLLLLSIPVALLAFIFSVIGLQETTLRPDIYKNLGLAIAGIVLTAGFLISVLISFIRSR